MKYKKNENQTLDTAFKSSSKHGFNVRLYEDIFFFKKGFHWEYIKREDVNRIYRRIEEVITHTSCCAENMDIQKFIFEMKAEEPITVHVCDGEPRLAENLYSILENSWTDISFGKK